MLSAYSLDMSSTVQLKRSLSQAPDWDAGEAVIDQLTVSQLYDRSGAFMEAFDSYLDPFGRESYAAEEEQRVLDETKSQLQMDLALLRRFDDAPANEGEDEADWRVTNDGTEMSISAGFSEEEGLAPSSPAAALSRLARAGVARAAGFTT